MKYGESLFDIAYLAFAIIMGLRILRKKPDETGRLMGLAVLILGIGDAFHLVPRVLNYFVEGDFTAALGIGKLITSLTMTVFYLLLYRLWHLFYHQAENSRLSLIVWLLVALRFVLCLLPQNEWLTGGSSVLWGTLRNIPFVILGALVICLYYRQRAAVPCLSRIWLLAALSFLFYVPVAVGASLLPMLGMLMLPKTVCYVLMILAMWRRACLPEA